MKFISTTVVKTNSVNSFTQKFAVVAATLLFSFCLSVKAQNTDLPNPTANIQTLPVGSLVIAMDNTNQANPGYFNLKAYGLAVTLMDFDVRLRWIITAGKVKDGVDINVNAFSITTPTITTAGSKISYISGSNTATISNITGSILPGMTVTSNAAGIPTGTTVLSIIDATHISMSANATATQNNKTATYTSNSYPVSNYNFKAGPFVIFPSDTTLAKLVIDLFNNSVATIDRVNVFQTTTPASVDVRYDLANVRPKCAILDDGGNATIHEGYMTDAAIPMMNYTVLTSATGLTSGCYTFASEPHNGLQGAQIDSIKSFVMLGGNFLAQCHAITSYENWTGGHFETTTGVNGNNGNIGTDINYINSDLSFSQYDGGFDANQGGSVQTWTFAAGSTPQNNFYGTVKGNTTALANTYGASGAKLGTGKGHNVWYIGNHSFSGNNLVDINGERMYMNAFLTPAFTPACDQARLLPVKLSYFAAKKVSEQHVQLNWATTAEHNTKEFIIQRSADGVNFSELTRVSANGNSSIEVKYNSYDYTPLAGRNFYRLITLDLDGFKSYSDIVLVNTSITAASKASLDIYPNPAHGVVTVNLNNLPILNNSLTVTSISGAKIISKEAMNGSALKLDVSQLQPGIYVVKVIGNDGISAQQKIIVKN